MYIFENKCFDIKYIYGIGCIFLVVIIVELVKGCFIKDVVKKVKEFILLSIEYILEIGKGRGFVNYFVYMKKVGLDDE